MKLLVLLFSLSFSAFAVDNGDVTYEYDILENHQSDILYVVDNSGSMYNLQKMLADFSGTFISSLGNINYKIAGISTSRNEEIKDNFVLRQDFDPAKSFEELILSFGTEGDAYEVHFDRIKEFYQSTIASKFYRNKALKEIVIITDEDDENSNFSVQETISLMERTNTTVSAIAVKNYKKCPSGTRIQSANINIIKLVEETKGTFIDLCEVNSENFSEKLEVLGKAILERASKNEGNLVPIKRLDLPMDVDYDSISISYGSQVIKRGYSDTGWIIKESENAIILGDDIVLSEQPIGTKFVIKFSLIK